MSSILIRTYFSVSVQSCRATNSPPAEQDHGLLHVLISSQLVSYRNLEVGETMLSSAYLYPLFPVVDLASSYISKEMKETVEAFDICVDEDVIEMSGVIRVVEIYHTLLRLAYDQNHSDSNR